MRVNKREDEESATLHPVHGCPLPSRDLYPRMPSFILASWKAGWETVVAIVKDGGYYDLSCALVTMYNVQCRHHKTSLMGHTHLIRGCLMSRGRSVLLWLLGPLGCAALVGPVSQFGGPTRVAYFSQRWEDGTLFFSR